MQFIPVANYNYSLLFADQHLKKFSIFNSEKIVNNDYFQVNYYITFALLCFYLLFVNIMLINLLIAIFSNTYADSEAKSGTIMF